MCSLNQKRVADSLTCSRLAVQCRDPDDMVYWNAVKAGEYDTWEKRCGDLVDSVDGLKWDDLKKNLETPINTQALLPVMN